LPGQYHDEETDLNQNWNRFYDPTGGRYTHPEPMWLHPKVALVGAVNGTPWPVYGYAWNNPINYSDVNGLGSGDPEDPEQDAEWIAAGIEELPGGEELVDKVSEVLTPITDEIQYGEDELVDYVEGLGKDAPQAAECPAATTEGAVSQGARTEPQNLAEQVSMEEAESGAGKRIMSGKIKDPRFPADQWEKMQHVHQSPNGSKVVIHYWQRIADAFRTGFKFK